MASLKACSALAGHAPIEQAGHRLRAPGDIAAVLVTSRTPLELPGAIALGPREWLLIGSDAALLMRIAQSAAEGATALATDMTDGFGFLEVSGGEALDLLGISALASAGGGSFTTRIADLRVTVRCTLRAVPTALLIVERSSADYLWAWVAKRLPVPGSTSGAAAISCV